MPITVVLAIGFDPWLFQIERTVSQSAGYFVTPANSVSEGIERFESGDFDLVLLGPSIPAESRDQLTHMIRASGSRIPVVCMNDATSHGDDFGHAAIKNEPHTLLQNIRERLAMQAGRAA